MTHRIEIRLEPLQGAAHAPLDEVQRQLWAMLCDYAARFTSSSRTLWEDYMQWAARQAETYEVTAETMVFALPDDGGEREVSAAVAAHWLRASLAAAYQATSSFVQDHGWLPLTNAPDLSVEVWNTERPVGWLQVGDDMLQFDFDDPSVLMGDQGVSIAADELTEEQRSNLDDAAERHLCPCHMCEMLRPDPDFEATMLDSVRDPNHDVVQSAIWYLRQTARVSVSTALAVARYGVGVPRDHAAACHDFGSKLDAEDLNQVLDAMQTAEDDVTRCGLLGLAAGMQLEAGSPGITRRLFTFVSALSEGSPVCEVAAEYAGYGLVADGHEDHFARGLVKQIGTSDEFDHNVALTLFNFYIGTPAVPAFALDAIARLASHDSEQVQVIAAFAHAQLLTKPVR